MSNATTANLNMFAITSSPRVAGAELEQFCNTPLWVSGGDCDKISGVVGVRKCDEIMQNFVVTFVRYVLRVRFLPLQNTAVEYLRNPMSRVGTPSILLLNYNSRCLAEI
jgi:hypothetical protein